MPKITSNALVWILVASVGAAGFYWDGLASLGSAWTRPEYSYGPLVPIITAYLFAKEIRHRPIVADSSFRGLGLAAFFLAIAFGALGNVARIPDITAYGFILFIGSILLLALGSREAFRLWPGWVHLIFMLPLPQFIYLHASTNLQTVSSTLGVSMIQLLRIPVYLDGNIIDLGNYKLQVAEACSGLRYLFPLFSFGWMIAVLYQGKNWHKVVIFISTVPITVLMNSFRIGVIGVLVNYFGISQADGFLHFFEGWVIFIACTLLLVLEAVVLAKFFSFPDNGPSHVLNVDFRGVVAASKSLSSIRRNRELAAAAVCSLIAAVILYAVPTPRAPEVARPPLGIFPMQLAEWSGRSTLLEPSIANVLAADDYLIADYQAGGKGVNVLLTYYESQTEGAGIHSPEVCLPAGGWEVAKWDQIELGVSGEGELTTLPINRAIIQKGLERQLVYYWFEQRGWRTTNDFEAKLWSVWGTISAGRSDGGLVRLVTPIYRGEEVGDADQRLKSFLATMLPVLPRYYPA